MPFAHHKTHHGFERLRLRGPSGGRDELQLAAIEQNLKTMALRLLDPPPNEGGLTTVRAPPMPRLSGLLPRSLSGLLPRVARPNFIPQLH